MERKILLAHRAQLVVARLGLAGGKESIDDGMGGFGLERAETPQPGR